MGDGQWGVIINVVDIEGDRALSAVVPLSMVDTVTSGWNQSVDGRDSGGLIRLDALTGPLLPSSRSLGKMMTKMTGAETG